MRMSWWTPWWLGWLAGCIIQITFYFYSLNCAWSQCFFDKGFNWWWLPVQSSHVTSLGGPMCWQIKHLTFWNSGYHAAEERTPGGIWDSCNLFATIRVTFFLACRWSQRPIWVLSLKLGVSCSFWRSWQPGLGFRKLDDIFVLLVSGTWPKWFASPDKWVIYAEVADTALQTIVPCFSATHPFDEDVPDMNGYWWWIAVVQNGYWWWRVVYDMCMLSPSTLHQEGGMH